MWLLAVICATLLCFFVMFTMIKAYLKFETINQSSNVFLNSIEFPSVVFCKTNFSLTDFNQTIKNCRFDKKKSNLDAISVFDSKGPKHECVSFNLNNTVKQRNFNDLVDGLLIEFYDFKLEDKVFYMYILKPRTVPLYSKPTLVIRKYTYNVIYINQVISESLAKPYTNCTPKEVTTRSSSDLIKRTYKFNGIYQNSRCQFLCKFKYYAETYNCSYSGLYETNSSLNCHEYVNNRENDPDIIKCLSTCPFECKTNAYIVNHLTSKNKFGSTIILMSYENQAVTFLDQTPKTTIDDLISKLGGTLGLFVGLKLLSFVDILEFSFEICYLTVIRTKKYLF